MLTLAQTKFWKSMHSFFLLGCTMKLFKQSSNTWISIFFFFCRKNELLISTFQEFFYSVFIYATVWKCMLKGVPPFLHHNPCHPLARLQWSPLTYTWNSYWGTHYARLPTEKHRQRLPPSPIRPKPGDTDLRVNQQNE